ncbi:unnamed protein product [marine sediment metagenome]|uniref:Uncharacterized protein n=1 Tax=marine sediment metagenome TaxID=412755 RepID=X1T366_9ZZZZ
MTTAEQLKKTIVEQRKIVDKKIDGLKTIVRESQERQRTQTEQQSRQG